MKGRRLVVALALFAACWPVGCRRHSGASTSFSANAPTQVLDGFDLQEMRSGQKWMTLQATQGRVYDADHHADLDSPVVTFYKNGRPSSVMKAPAGKVDMVTHAIEAWNGVTVVSADSSTLTTERLNYDPKEHKIISHTHVRLEKPGSVTEGESLEADPDLTRVVISRQQVRMKGMPEGLGQ